MPNLKEKILQILDVKNFTYADLATHLALTEKELDFALKHNTLEIRTLELISKELRIPLYSFFRENFEDLGFPKQPYYNINIWSKEENKYLVEMKKLREEVEKLKADLHNKDLLIDALEGQIK